MLISKFVELETAQPAPAPVDDGEDPFKVELPTVEDDEDVLSDGEAEPDSILDIFRDTEDRNCSMTDMMSVPWNLIAQTFERSFNEDLQEYEPLDFMQVNSLQLSPKLFAQTVFKPSWNNKLERIAHSNVVKPVEDMTQEEILDSLIVSQIVCRRNQENKIKTGFAALENEWTNIYVQHISPNSQKSL